MTTLYNGSLTVQGLFTPVAGPTLKTTADTIVSILNNIEYCSQQRVMMEIGSYNTTCGNFGNIYKYALGFSNSISGSGGSFLIQACPVSTTSYANENPSITLITLNTSNMLLSVPLSVNGAGRFKNSLSLYNDSTLAFNVANSGIISFETDVWHSDLRGANRIQFRNNSHTDFNSGGNYYFNTNNIIRLTIDYTGNVVANGDVTAFSDVRVKKNIVTIDSPLEKINAMRGVYYTRIDTPGPRHIGVIAQEIETVLPEVVLTSGPNGNKSVAYANIVALLIEGIKEQGKQISTLQANIQDLQSKVAVLDYTLEEEQTTLKLLQPMVLNLEDTLEEQQSTITHLHPAVIELQSTVKEEQIALETVQEIIGSLEKLNLSVPVNEDAEVDTESNIQGVD
jgi:hypothetical protein